VESHVISRLPAHPASLLDIGAGDGSRALRIAGIARISKVILLEPGPRMASATPTNVECWSVRAEELEAGNVGQRFDVITCLWNVLGHIQGSAKRIRALKNAAQLLSPVGLLFVDVIHRYNIRSYGTLATTARWLRDHVAPGERNGDVVARWQTSAGTIATYGHVFTDREMRRLAKAAELELVERVVIDYENGATRRFSCMGNLLYVFRRTSRSDSSKAPQTS
jgi:2-polyprenyl-3-methyl-5-hydroxy-6-metoxy-1,4-benzoquinol methylase